MPDSDAEAIRRLVTLYGVAVDAQRWALFDGLFTADVEADFGPTSHWRDLASFKRDFAAFHAPFDATQHAMTSHLADVDGDHARALTYGSWLLVRRGLEGGDSWRGAGWYDDALTRGADGWRIRRRVCRVVWWDGNPRVQAPDPNVVFQLDLTSLRQEADAGRVGVLGRAAQTGR